MLKSSLVIAVNNDKYFTIIKPRLPAKLEAAMNRITGKKESINKPETEPEPTKDIPIDDVLANNA